MGLNAASLKLMAAKGLSAADIAEIAEAMESASDTAAERRRAWDRERKRKQRDGAISTGHSTGNPPDPSPNERDILTPTRITPKPNGLDPSPIKRKHRLPESWEPMTFKAGTQAALVVLRWEPGRLERELSKFRDHHTATGSRFENWQAAWSKWVNNSDDFKRGHSGTGNPSIGKSQAAWAMLNPGDEPF